MKNLKTFNLNWRFTFGKYKGKELSYVIHRNPDYVEWCLHTIKWFRLSKRAKKELDDAMTFYEEDDVDPELEMCFIEAYGPWGDN